MAFIMPLLTVSFVSCDKLQGSETDVAQQEGLSIDFEKYELDNGLNVVLHQDKSDPIVSVAIQYGVGSNREKKGRTGFAHLFEHMLSRSLKMFRRTSSLKKFRMLEELLMEEPGRMERYITR